MKSVCLERSNNMKLEDIAMIFLEANSLMYIYQVGSWYYIEDIAFLFLVGGALCMNEYTMYTQKSLSKQTTIGKDKNLFYKCVPNHIRCN